jgi:8-oxo-dGTP diphosphatase
VREIKEETGAERQGVDRPLGDRIHPKTGRPMTYLACSPANGTTDVYVGDADELAEVRWVSLVRGS